MTFRRKKFTGRQNQIRPFEWHTIKTLEVNVFYFYYNYYYYYYYQYYFCNLDSTWGFSQAVCFMKVMDMIEQTDVTNAWPMLI